MSNQRSPIGHQVFGKIGAADKDAVAKVGLSIEVLDNNISGIEGLFDPDVASPELMGESGWRISRQHSKGELVRSHEQIKERFGRVPDGFATPDPTRGADPDWPSWARFLAEVEDPDYFGEVDHPVMYYTAKSFTELVEEILVVYVLHHPEEQVVVDRIRLHANFWIEHDASHSPGES